MRQRIVIDDARAKEKNAPVMNKRAQSILYDFMTTLAASFLVGLAWSVAAALLVLGIAQSAGV